MNRRLLFSALGIFIFAFNAFASPIAGGEITYKSLGNKKYEIIFKFYRDCRGTAESLSTFNFGLHCPSSGQSKKLTPTLVSISEVSNACKTNTTKCDPPNTTISSSWPIFEEHTYQYTLDFNNGESAFAGCCVIKLFMNRCCRNNNINTGPAGSDFYITSDLDICNTANNSSPIFTFPPQFIQATNRASYVSFAAMDTVDHDSLSYTFTEPLQSLTTNVSWSGSFNLKEPLSVYWPVGYDKNKGPRPDANPPIGLFLGAEDGDVVFTPTDTNQTIMCVAVREWRKDISGKYMLIGEIRREMNLIVKMTPLNNPPLLNGPYKYEICAGTQICFTVTSDDKQYIPPPPAKANPPDTVRITWNRGIPGATFTIVDPKARLQSGKFCWTPKEKDASDLPYTFTVTAMDNSCPFNGLNVRSYSVNVKVIARTSINLKNISNNEIRLESKPALNFKGTPGYYWELRDSTGQILDTSSVNFTGNKSNTSVRQSDTVTFSKTGNFFIYHRINNSPLNCPSIYVDTIQISKLGEMKNLKNNFTHVYPNPAHELLTIQQLKPFSNSSFEVYNSLGELILKGALLQKETTLNISSFVNGVYFLKVKSEKMTGAFQFIKLE